MPGLANTRSCSVRAVISPTRAAVSYNRMSSIRFRRDFVVRPVKAARTARVSSSVRYSMGDLGLVEAACFGCLAESDERDVLMGAVGQERFDGGEPQRDGPESRSGGRRPSMRPRL